MKKANLIVMLLTVEFQPIPAKYGRNAIFLMLPKWRCNWFGNIPDLVLAYTCIFALNIAVIGNTRRPELYEISLILSVGV